MLQELKECEHGMEVVGIPLVVKTARNTFIDGDEKCWQDVLFMDASGEMPGQVLLPEYSPSDDGSKYDNRKKLPPKVWQSKARLFVVKGEVQDADVRKKEARKLVVFECKDMAVRLTYNQYDQLAEEEAEEYHLAQDKRIRGMVRHGIVCAMITAEQIGNEGIATETKDNINKMVDYIIDGI